MPPTTRQARVSGVALNYVEQGQGAPVVFVHGATIDHRAWEGQREAVARCYRYIALTQRYFGTDPWPDAGEQYSLTTHADDLTTFIRNLKAGPVHLVGEESPPGRVSRFPPILPIAVFRDPDSSYSPMAGTTRPPRIPWHSLMRCWAS